MRYFWLLLLLLAQSVSAATWVVQKTGSSDSNPCTAAQPCLTINAGIAKMARGDTLLIGGGTYVNQCIGDGTGQGGVPVPTGFSWFSPTQISAKPGEVVWLQAQGSGTNGCPDPSAYSVGMLNFEVVRDNYIEITGINIDGNSTAGRYSNFDGAQFLRYQLATAQLAKGIGFWNAAQGDGNEATSGQHNEFLDLQVLQTGTNPATEVGAHGFYAVGWYGLFDRLLIDDSNCWGLQWTNSHGAAVTGNVLQNSTVRRSPCGGVAAFPGNFVYNTIFLENESYGGLDGYGLNATHNIFFNNSCGISLKGGGHQLRNNLSMGQGGSDMCDSDNASVSVAQANMCSSISGDNALGCTMTGTPSAVFEDAAAGDFRHKPTSPAINQGVVVAAVPTDRLDVARGSQPDLGAFEFTTEPPGPGPAVAVQFGTQPTTTALGQPISPAPTVRIVDAAGTLISSTATVTLTLTGTGGGTLSGVTSQAAVGGIAMFPGLTVSPANSGYTLLAQSTGLTSATSASFTITAPVPAFLAFDIQPSTTVSGVVMTPAVTVLVKDADGNVVLGSTIPVTVALQQNPAGGTLSGTLTRNAVAGTATFNNLSVATVGTGYTLGATTTTPGVAADQSDFFAITAAPPVGLLAPSNLRSTLQTVTATGEIQMAWDYTQGSPLATGFIVEEQPACSGAFSARPGMPQGLTQTYTRSALPQGSLTCWRVKAVEGANASAPSNTLSWTVPVTVPPPTDLTVTTFSSGFFLTR